MIVTDIGKLVFVGFNGNVVALDEDTGQIAWKWEAPDSVTGDVAMLLLDSKRMIACVDGYTYCLNPMTGEQLWLNELEGLGSGFPSLVSGRNASSVVQGRLSLS